MMDAETKAAWLAERAGKLTASRMKDAMDFLKNGDSSQKRLQYLYDLLAERLTGDSIRHYVTDAMQRGLDLEDEMFDVFVETTGRTIKRSRFYEHPRIENFGATPDREIDEDGLLEGKVPQISTYVKWRLSPGTVPAEHRAQMTAQLACSGKKWVGFIAYCPEMKNERDRLFMVKFVPTAQEIQAVEDAATKFLTDLDNMFDQFVNAGHSLTMKEAA